MQRYVSAEKKKKRDKLLEPEGKLNTTLSGSASGTPVSEKKYRIQDKSQEEDDEEDYIKNEFF